MSHVLFFSRPWSEASPHHGHTFSIYLCPPSFWMTLPRRVLSMSWCGPSRLWVVLACLHPVQLPAPCQSPHSSPAKNPLICSPTPHEYSHNLSQSPTQRGETVKGSASDIMDIRYNIFPYPLLVSSPHSRTLLYRVHCHKKILMCWAHKYWHFH